MTKSERFGLVLSAQEKALLWSLAHKERVSAADVVRRLVWREAQRLHLLPTDGEDTLPLTTEEANNDS